MISKKEKVVISLIGAMFLSLTSLFFGPLYIFFTNINEFSYSLSDIWLNLILYTVLTGLVFTLLLVCLKDQFFVKVWSFIIGVGFLFWFQGNILVWNYGLLTGQEIPWNEYRTFGIIDSSIWVAVLGLTFFLMKSLNMFFLKIRT